MRSRALYTPPVTPPESSAPEVAGPTVKGGGAEGVEGEGGEVVTREPYRKVRLDHLLSREINLLERKHFNSNRGQEPVR